MHGTNEVLREAAPPLQIFEGARGERLQHQWSALVRAVDGVSDSEAFKDAALCLWTEEQRAPTEDVIEKTMLHVQRLVNRHQQDAQRERLMAMFNIRDRAPDGANDPARLCQSFSMYT